MFNLTQKILDAVISTRIEAVLKEMNAKLDRLLEEKDKTQEVVIKVDGDTCHCTFEYENVASYPIDTDGYNW